MHIETRVGVWGSETDEIESLLKTFSVNAPKLFTYTSISNVIPLKITL